MIKEKMYDFYSINNIDGLLEKCLDKDIFLKALENSTPTPVNEFNSDGSKWNLWEYYDIYEFFINGNCIYIQTLMESLSTFFDFLIRIIYYDSEKLIVNLEDEGSYMAIVALPLDNNKVRFSIFDYGLIYNKKILSDTIIDKTLLIKGFNEIFKRLEKDLKKDKYKYNRTHLMKSISETIDIFDMYLDDSSCFKDRYKLPKYYRVFNVAVKTLENGWKFTLAFEDDDKCEPKYWKDKKQSGEILDYDIIELDAMYKDDYNYKEYRKISKLEVISDEYLEDIFQLNEDRLDSNWFHSPETNKWYAPNEIAPKPKKIRHYISYMDAEIIIPSYEEHEEEVIKNYLNWLSIRGHEDLECNLISQDYNGRREGVLVDFNYGYAPQMREALKKIQKGESIRVIAGNVMQVIVEESDDAIVSFYDSGDVDNELLTSFSINRERLIEDFSNILDKIENKVKTIEYALEQDKKLNISKNFSTEEKHNINIEYLDNFIGGYACATVKHGCAGIVNKNLEWVVNPYKEVKLGRIDELGIQEHIGKIWRICVLKNIDGNYFIATIDNTKQIVIDINYNIQIPFVSDNIYYQYLKDKLYFIVIEKDKTFVVNSKGKYILTLDFAMGEKFWLFEDIIILSKNNMYGIIDWNGKTIIDFIFSDIKPEAFNLDFIPVKYINSWGFINKNGEVINMKIKDNI